MNLTGAEISAFVGSFLWPFFRIGAALQIAPLIGSTNVPTRIRLGIAIVLTLVIMPVLPPMPKVDALTLPSVLVIIQQVLVGSAMGFTLQLVFNAVVTGGQLIATQMGLGFASMVDPQNGQQVPVLAQLYLMLVALIFFAMNGHLLLVELLAESFRVLPVGATGFSPDAYWSLAVWGGKLFAGAVWLALPAVGALMVVNIAFGVMARAAPQLNIFSIGFPVSLVMGFSVLIVVLPVAAPQFTALLGEGFNLLRRLLGEGS